MPSPLIHTAIALAAGHQGGKSRQLPIRVRDYAALIVAANAADLDFIPGLFSESITHFHHQASHSVFFSLILALACWAFTRRYLGILFLVALSHPIIDLLTVDVYHVYSSHWGIPLLWPFLDTPFWPVAPIFGCPYVGSDLSMLFSWVNIKIGLRECGVLAASSLVYLLLIRIRTALAHQNETPIDP